MTIITIEHVSKTFPPPNYGEAAIQAVHNVSFKVQQGEVIVILGPSGCGKSTLLRLVAGLIKPDEGRVLYNNENLQSIPRENRGIGMVFQNFALVPHWHSEENISFFMRLRHREAEVPERVHQIANITGIDLKHLMGRFPRQLSGGEKQRVAIARALTRDLEILLLDEPFANLDAKFRTAARIELKRLLYEFKVTTVYVTHDQVEATALADRILVMRDGHLEQIGSFDLLYNSPVNTFVAEFVGSPPMNLFQGHVEAGHWVGESFGGYPIRSDLADGTRITMGARAEAFYLKPDGVPAVVETSTAYFDKHVRLLEVWIGGEHWTMTVPLENEIEVGSTIYCDINPTDILFFDTHTGQRIG